MKTILVPTDFSEVSENALNYAAEFANFAKAKLVLFHVYAVPMPVSEVPVIAIPIDEVEHESMKQLKEFDKKLKANYGNIETELITRAGFVAEEIYLFQEERKIDLLVMGVTGAGKAPGILGSNTTSNMKKAKCPVLVVPKGLKFKKPEKIALACDYNSTVPEGVVSKLKEFVRLFGAKLLVFDVLKRAELVSYQKAVAEVNLENSLGDEIEHSLYFPSGDGKELHVEINSFVDRNNADMLVMIPHDYSFWQKLFHHSATKEMAFYTHVPLLSIHE
jgi:nucleotide-binding universal stress UspA family protein